ncbi:MAG: tetratricopeptide repeat protein, partial [Patescibacteria group bacterium]|nr:tetratricopeptide repeat protein [Patescibacteria group bacterium]
YLLCLIIYGVYAFKSFKSNLLKTVSAVLTISAVAGFVLCLSQVLPGKPFAHKMPSYQVSWTIAIDSLKVSPIWGVGPGNYLSAFSRFKPIEYNQTDIWNLRYQSASSQYLGVLTEVGIVGLSTFLVLMLFVYKNIKSKDSKQKEILRNASIVVLLFIFVFFPASTITFYSLFILLALASNTKKMGITLVAKNENEELTIGSAFSRMPAVVLTLPFFAFVLWVVYNGLPIVQAERYFAQALEARKENKVQETLELLNKTVQKNRYVDRYHIISAQINLLLANAIVNNARTQAGGQITDEQRSAIGNLIQLSIQAAKNAVILNPQRAGNWELLAGVYRSIIGVAEGAENFAAQSYRQAINLDRFNPVTWVLYGGVFYAKADYDNAIKAFETAVSLKQDYANARFNLAYAYFQKKNYDAAIDQMTRVVSLVKKDTPDYELAVKTLNDFKAQKSASTQPAEELTPPTEAQPITPPLDLPENSAPPQTQTPSTPSESLNNNNRRSPTNTTLTPTPTTPIPAP